jgi:GMP synthase (glutamine-hydrolysing)
VSARRALALRHVAFEDAGLIAAATAAAGLALDYVEAPLADFSRIDPLSPELLVVLGGPIGVYETEAYPFLVPEIALIRARLEADRPTLGVCLGAQLMAVALGGSVGPGPAKEIGYWPPLWPGEDPGPLAPLADVGWRALHWHGDQISPPAEASSGVRVHASTSLTPVQAFSRGPRVLGLQFHLEVEPEALESWFVGHACEIAATRGVSVEGLRSQARAHGALVAAAGRRVIDRWLAGALA